MADDDVMTDEEGAREPHECTFTILYCSFRSICVAEIIADLERPLPILVAGATSEKTQILRRFINLMNTAAHLFGDKQFQDHPACFMDGVRDAIIIRNDEDTFYHIYSWLSKVDIIIIKTAEFIPRTHKRYIC